LILINLKRNGTIWDVVIVEPARLMAVKAMEAVAPVDATE
jgi:hypothetical protein